MEICSWYPFIFYKYNGTNSTIKSNERIAVSPYKEYDETRNNLQELVPDKDWFFDNMSSLLHSIGLPNIFHFSENENASYANCVLWSRNIYLSFTIIHDVENTLYWFSIKTWTKNCMNSFMVRDNSENVFNAKCIISSYNIYYSSYIKNSDNIWFSNNLIWCHECIDCNDLENASYYIKNKQYDVDEYHKRKKEILSHKDMFEQYATNKYVSWNNYNSTNTQNSSYVVESEDIINGQYLSEISHARNAILVGWNGSGEHVYDCLLNTPELSHIYWWLSLWTGTDHIYCSMHITVWSHIYYSIYCQSCSFCLGCIWLKNRSFCIFNKQYSKEDRHTKVDEIFSQMERDWTLGDFFPGEMNPFYFNDTAAHLIDPSFTKEEATRKWYLRRDEEISVDIPEWMDVVAVDDLSNYEWFDENGKRNIDPIILKKVIRDEKWNIYRIVQMEYDFLVKHELPLPRKHRLDRIKENFRVD